MDAMDDGPLSDESMKDKENDDTASASEAGNEDDGNAVNKDETLLNFGCVKAEIAIVAVTYTQPKEIQVQLNNCKSKDYVTNNIFM
jgi:hypothetical protein